jgi:hypothetical protein
MTLAASLSNLNEDPHYVGLSEVVTGFHELRLYLFA